MKGYFADFETWFLDCDLDSKLFRLWHKNWPDGAECSFVYLVTWVSMPNGRILIGYIEDWTDNETIDFCWLDEISLSYRPKDIEEREDF